jgi:hypothetical protein
MLNIQIFYSEFRKRWKHCLVSGETFVFVKSVFFQVLIWLTDRVYLASHVKTRTLLHTCKTTLTRVRTKLERPWMSLNLKTKIQGLECPWICKEVLECPWILLALVFGYFLKFVWHSRRTFCWTDFACSYLT